MILSPTVAILLLLQQSQSSDEIYQFLDAEFPNHKMQHILVKHDTDFQFKFFADESQFKLINIIPHENQKFGKILIDEIISKIKLHTNVVRGKSLYIIKFCKTNCPKNHKHGFHLLRRM